MNMSDKPEWGSKEWYKLHPIFGTNMTLDPEVSIEGIRMQISRLRGQLNDIQHGYGHKENLEVAQNGLTLVISYLYYTIEEIKKNKERNSVGRDSEG